MKYNAAGASAPEEGVNVKDMNENAEEAKPSDNNVVDAEVVDTPEQSGGEKKKKK